MAGGACRSEVWLQLHADVTGLPVVVGECPDAPLLGAACLAATAAGIYDNPLEASRSMYRAARRIEPRSDVTEAYHEVYRRRAPSLN